MSFTKTGKDKLRRYFKIFSSIFKFLLLLIILIGIPLYLYFFHRDIIEQFSTLEDVNAFFREYRTQSIFIYVAVQILQIVICVIPGQWLQFAAGYMYGFWIGYLLSLAGALIGTVITYYLARILGHDIMHLIFSEEKIRKMLKTLNSKKAVVLVFLLYLIPGFPKDICSYVAGLSELKLKPFLIISLIGRSPGMMGSLLIGRQVEVGGYVSAVVIAAIALILCLLGIAFRKQITAFMDKAYHKLMRMQ